MGGERIETQVGRVRRQAVFLKDQSACRSQGALIDRVGGKMPECRALVDRKSAVAACKWDPHLSRRQGKPGTEWVDKR